MLDGIAKGFWKLQKIDRMTAAYFYALPPLPPLHPFQIGSVPGKAVNIAKWREERYKGSSPFLTE